MRSLVVFHDHSANPLHKFLKKGFRHVFAVAKCGDYWVSFEGRRNRLPYMDVVAGADYDLATFYREQGFTVVEVDKKRRRTLWPFMISNCMGAAKKTIGVNSPFVLTPYQLYKYLTKRGTNARNFQRTKSPSTSATASTPTDTGRPGDS